MVDSPFLVQPGGKFRLADRPTDDTGKFKEKAEAQPAVEKNLARMEELQELLYAEARHALLVVIQAMDTGGKDGTIEHVFHSVDPQGCTVASFKKPTSLELSHDFLWRIHAAVPPRGMIGIFNRSHYESLLVERVRELVPKAVWSRRFEHVNNFEKMLADEGVTIVKFYLHISKDEQKRRLESRLRDAHKQWTFDPADLEERVHWDGYMEAYEDVLRKCSQPYAPWYVIPADRKWYRNWAVSEVLVKTMEALKMEWPKPRPGLEKFAID